MNNLIIMDKLSQKEEIFLNLYTKHKHNETAESIKKTHGHLINDKMNFQSVVELGSNFMFMFGKTNGQEMYDFIQKNKVTFSDNVFKSIYSTLFKKDIEVNVDFKKIKENVFDNFDLVSGQAATFLKEVGCTDNQVKYFNHNITKFKDMAETLVHDYFYYTKQPIQPELLEGKHLKTIFTEMGNGYDNIKLVFTDTEKLNDWRYDHNLLINPCKAILTHGNTSVDLVNNLGGGYEISTLIKDKAFFEKIKNEHMSYEPASRLYQSMLETIKADEEPTKKNKSTITKP